LEKPGSISLQRKLLAVILACAILALNSCKRDSESHRELAAHMTQTVVAENSTPPTLPPCPDAPYPKLNAKDAATGHHRVF
jgi:hypothetical protein